MNKTIVLLALTITSPALADEIRIEFCPGIKAPNTNMRMLKSARFGTNKKHGYWLACANALNKEAYLLMDSGDSFAIHSNEECEEIQASMDANPKNAFMFILDKYEKAVVVALAQPNRICDENGGISSK